MTMATARERSKWDQYYANLPLVEPDASTNEFNMEFVEAVKELLPTGGRILEAGCGGGWQSLALAREGGYQVTVLDFSEEALGYTERVFRHHNCNAEYLHRDAFQEGSPDFDLVFNAGVVEHYTPREQASLLRAMASYSRNYVIALAPNPNCYWYWLWRARTSAEGGWLWGREVPLSEMSQAVVEAGLRFSGHSYFGASWTRHFIQSALQPNATLAEELLVIHDSPVIPLDARAYLTAVLGTKIEAKIPPRWNAAVVQSADEARAALADSLALRIAAERMIANLTQQCGLLTSSVQLANAGREAENSALAGELKRAIDLHEKSSAAFDEERNALLAKYQSEANGAARALRDAETAESRLEAERISFEKRLQSEEERTAEARLTAAQLGSKLESVQAEATQLGGKLAAAEADMAELRQQVARYRQTLSESLSAAKRTAAAERTAWQREREELERRSARALQAAETLRNAGIDGFVGAAKRQHEAESTLRAQRAWTVMVAIREMYARWTRESGSAKWEALQIPFRLLTGGYQPSPDYDAQFPDPMNEVPAVFDRPVSIAETVGGPLSAAFDCIVLPIFDFEFRHQRPQQLAAAFAATNHRVYWVSPSRPSSLADGVIETIPLRPNLWEIRLPGAPFSLYGGQLTDAAVERAMCALEVFFQANGIDENAVLVQFPYWRRLALALRERHGSRIAYDLMDDWKNWPTEPRIGPFAIEEESRLVKECDVFTVTASEFVERYRENSPAPVLVRNGTEFEFFHQPAGVAKRLAGYSRPIVGYYGAISTWFDLELLTEVATLRPAYSFILIGGVHKTDVGPLAALPNVTFLGEKNYRELPGFLSEFDVCLIPFRINTLTKAVDPVKFYEYLSQGKPVVASPMEELLPHRELLYLASGADEFARAIDSALHENKNDAVKARRLEFAKKNGWHQRACVVEAGLRARFPLVSILVVTYNSAEFASLFAESLLSETTYPNFEVICADNGSTDGTPGLLREAFGTDPRFQVIDVGANLGFAGGNNFAARRAEGEYIVFLNPDTVLTRGWLGRLLAPLWKDSSIGMTAPVTNFSANETKVDWDYASRSGLRRFARLRANEFKNQTLDIPMIPLLCAAVSAAVWKEIGELDEAFGAGMFEDDDYSVRVKKSGRRLVTAEDCYIHHFGNGSFANLDAEECLRLFNENKRRFQEKWNTTWEGHSLRPGVRELAKDRRLKVEHLFNWVESETAVAPPALRIVSLHPREATAGLPTNVQPDGSSALSIACENVAPNTIVEIDGIPLATTYGNAQTLSAIVPAALLAAPRIAQIRLSSDMGSSDTVPFPIRLIT